jgi:hypothetical protein
MLTHPPRAFPVGDEPPVGAPQVKGKHRRPARARRPRPRICLRKGCGGTYQPRAWNQRYCQEPECRRLVRRWQAARRQAARRQDPEIRAQHAQAESARRQQAQATSQTAQEPQLAPARGHAADAFFLLPYATGQAATSRQQTRPATRRATVGQPAARPFATSTTASASGSLAALWMVARSGPMNTRPPASTDSRGIPTPRFAHRRGRLLSDRPSAPRRSSIIAWSFPG